MSIWIRISDGSALISHSAPAVERAAIRTALVEARGALLSWDAASDERFPDAEIHDPVQALAWLAEIYSVDIAAAVRAAVDASLPLPQDAELVDAAHRLAALSWARHWWPAGIYTPALNGAILAAETVLAAHAVEHLLDDEDAVERALHEAAGAPSALAMVPPRLRADAASLADALTSLADDHGVVLDPAVISQPEGWALAAGARTQPDDGIEISHGTSPVRWADVPAQTVAADSDAQWSLRHVDGVPHLHIWVAAVPGATADLWARFGPESLDIDVPLHGDGNLFTGHAQVAASVALLPLDDRTLWVRDPILAPVPGPPEAEDDRDAVREHAVARLDDPQSSLAERAAAE